MFILLCCKYFQLKSSTTCRLYEYRLFLVKQHILTRDTFETDVSTGVWLYSENGQQKKKQLDFPKMVQQCKLFKSHIYFYSSSVLHLDHIRPTWHLKCHSHKPWKKACKRSQTHLGPIKRSCLKGQTFTQ